MTASSDASTPTVYYRERFIPSPLALIVIFLACVAFFVGPVQLYGAVFYGDAAAWRSAFLWGAGWGVGTALFVTVYNYFTVLTIDERAIRCLDRTIPLESITRWARGEGKELRRWRSHLTSDQGGSHPIGIGIWALRGGRNKVFCPPWMPTGFLFAGINEPVLVGTRHPEEFLSALRTALGPARVRDIESGKAAREHSAIPPEIKEAARRVVDDLMPRHSSNGQFHGHHRKQHEQPPR